MRKIGLTFAPFVFAKKISQRLIRPEPSVHTYSTIAVIILVIIPYVSIFLGIFCI